MIRRLVCWFRGYHMPAVAKLIDKGARIQCSECGAWLG